MTEAMNFMNTSGEFERRTTSACINCTAYRDWARRLTREYLAGVLTERPNNSVEAFHELGGCVLESLIDGGVEREEQPATLAEAEAICGPAREYGGPHTIPTQEEFTRQLRAERERASADLSEVPVMLAAGD